MAIAIGASCMGVAALAAWWTTTLQPAVPGYEPPYDASRMPSPAQVGRWLREARSRAGGDASRTLEVFAQVAAKNDPDVLSEDHHRFWEVNFPGLDSPIGPKARQEFARETLELLGAYADGLFSPQIVGGDPAGEAFPQVVAVGTTMHRCGKHANACWCCSGVLIASNAVLTARHCFEPGGLGRPRSRNRADRLWVYFGPGAGGQGKVVRVERQYQSLIDPDLAVLVLEEHVTSLDGRAVAPIKFATTNQIDTAPSVTVVGFGLTEERTAGEKRYGSVHVAVRTHVPGSPEHNLFGSFEPHEFIASDAARPDPPQTPVDTCDGDSGGPALVFQQDGTPRLAGITRRAIRTDGRSSGCGDGGVYVRADAPGLDTWLRLIPEIRWPPP
jgi:hypothetical protein